VIADMAQVEERRQRLIKSFCAKAPVYENCRMLSHDGVPLSFIDYRKLTWYEVSSCPCLKICLLCLLACALIWQNVHASAHSSSQSTPFFPAATLLLRRIIIIQPWAGTDNKKHG